MKNNIADKRHIVGLVILSLLCVTLSLAPLNATAENDSENDSTKVTMTERAPSSSEAPASPLDGILDSAVIIPRLDFAGISLRDALTALSRGYNLSMYVDSTVVGKVSVRLDNVSLKDALAFLIKEYSLSWERTGDIIKISKPIVPPPPLEPLNILYEEGRLSLELKAADLARVIDTLTDLTKRNIILDNGLRGSISGKVTDLPFEKALEVILSANGYSIRKVDDIIYVGRLQTTGEPGTTPRNLFVSCNDDLVSVDIQNGSLANTVSSIGRQCGINILIQTQLEGNITAAFENRTVEDALTSLLMNSQYTYKLTDGIYYIGGRESRDLYDTKLIMLDHLIASVVEPLIPTSLSEQVAVKVVVEHNGLLVTGPATSIARIRSFIKEVDIPTAQVLFEVIVVDYRTTDRAEFGITANSSGESKPQPGEIYYPNVDINQTGDDVNRSLSSLERRLSIGNLGRVGADFFVRLQAMEQEGIANVQSHPQIAALNGHTASISIGTSQYYLLESNTVYPSQQSNVSTQTSQRFEIIKADMSLEVTPFVSPNGELTVEVKPEFSTPVGSFDADIPPTINTRVLESTVRLMSGETIVLGGLVQTSKEKTIDKFPILGSLPLIGRIFQNRRSTEIKSEFVIYVTPHVYFGSDGAVNLDSLLISR